MRSVSKCDPEHHFLRRFIPGSSLIPVEKLPVRFAKLMLACLLLSN